MLRMLSKRSDIGGNAWLRCTPRQTMASVIALACGLASVAALCIGWIVVTLLVLACAYWVYLRLTTRGVLSPDYAVGELLSGSLIRRVLVTGCDTGFGNKLAMQLYAQGFHVIATCRLKSSARTLAAHGDRCVAAWACGVCVCC